MEICPCGADPYEDCCGRYHRGEAAPTAEALMRSRYAAFVLELSDYLVASLHPSKRTRGLKTALEQSFQETRYLGLEVLKRQAGGLRDTRGQVEFRALFEADPIGYRQEDSRFVKEDGRWFYVDGEACLLGLGRNDPCWCRSGRKLKKCHGS